MTQWKEGKGGLLLPSSVDTKPPEPEVTEKFPTPSDSLQEMIDAGFDESEARILADNQSKGPNPLRCVRLDCVRRALGRSGLCAVHGGTR